MAQIKEKPAVKRNRIKDLKLSSLLEVTKAINNNFSKDQLYHIYQFVLKDQLNIGKALLYSYDKGWEKVLHYGVDLNKLKINVEKDLLSIDEITEVSSGRNKNFKGFDQVIPVYHKAMPLAYLLIGDIHEDKIEVSPTIKHLPFIQTLTNIIIVAIENKRLAKENIKQEGVRRELELASEMQNMLFPAKLPDNKFLQVAAYYQPHHQVGGDYYDLIKLNDHEVMICIADVSGKGVSAALLMANFQANLRAIVNHTTSLNDIVHELNQQVMSNAKGEKFITLFIGKYNMLTHVFTYINAGHNPPLILNGKSSSWLKTGCTGLGMFDELIKVREGVLNVSPGTVLVCYTDGLIELENDDHDDFGMDRLKKLVLNNSTLTMNSLIEVIKNESVDFRQHQPYQDDIALLACRFF